MFSKLQKRFWFSFKGGQIVPPCLENNKEFSKLLKKDIKYAIKRNRNSFSTEWNYAIIKINMYGMGWLNGQRFWKINNRS